MLPTISYVNDQWAHHLQFVHGLQGVHNDWVSTLTNITDTIGTKTTQLFIQPVKNATNVWLYDYFVPKFADMTASVVMVGLLGEWVTKGSNSFVMANQLTSRTGIPPALSQLVSSNQQYQFLLPFIENEPGHNNGIRNVNGVQHISGKLRFKSSHIDEAISKLKTAIIVAAASSATGPAAALLRYTNIARSYLR